MSRGGAGRGAWEGRELTLGTWGGWRGGVLVEDEQGSGGKSGKSRLRTWRSRGGAGLAGGGAGLAGGDSGMSRGGDWRSRGGEDEEQRRSNTCREVARRQGPAAGTTKSDSGTSEWRRAPFYSSHTSISRLAKCMPSRVGNPPAL